MADQRYGFPSIHHQPRFARLDRSFYGSGCGQRPEHRDQSHFGHAAVFPLEPVSRLVRTASQDGCVGIPACDSAMPRLPASGTCRGQSEREFIGILVVSRAIEEVHMRQGTY